MITEMDIYWAFRLSTISEVSSMIATISAAILVLGVIFSISLWIEEQDSNGLKLRRIVKKTLIAVAISLFLSTTAYVFVPTTKQYIAMKVVPAIVNNQKIQSISDKSLQVVEKILDIKLNELEKEIQPPTEKK